MHVRVTIQRDTNERGLRRRRRYSSYAPVHIGVKIGGCGRGDGDDRPHGNVDMSTRDSIDIARMPEDISERQGSSHGSTSPRFGTDVINIRRRRDGTRETRGEILEGMSSAVEPPGIEPETNL
jgi:hypothetical protein